MTDGQSRSLFFSGSNVCPLLFPFFCFCPSYFCPSLLLPPLNHSIDTSRCYRTFNILLSVTNRLRRIPDGQPTPGMLQSREQISALLSRPPQRRYRIALPILLNTCCTTSDNTHLPSEVSTEPDLSFDKSTTFELCVTSRIGHLQGTCEPQVFECAFHSIPQSQRLLTSRSDRRGVSKSCFVGSHRPIERPDPEDVETLSDAEQLCRVSCTNRRSNMADTDRPLQETVENAYARLPESITI